MSSTAARKNRPTRAPAPPLPPFESLDRTHRDVLAILERFDQLLDRVEREGSDEETRRTATEIIDFFNGHARQHHLAEEATVFPALLESGDAELVQHVQRLRQDHGWLEEDWIEIEPQLDAIAHGYVTVDLVMLRHSLPVYAELYREHIALEESLIYPEARRRLGLPAADSGSAPAA